MSRKLSVTIGAVYGRLTVTSRAGSTPYGASLWRCLCECGTKKIQRASQLTSGASVSCGCFAREQTSKRVRTHGATNTFEFSVWKAMRSRCLRPTHVRYHRYGGRGIRICKRWDTFEKFLADMGVCPFPKGSIERKDNDGNYTPSNCVWLPKAQQAVNRVGVRRIAGLSLTAYAEKYNVPASTLRLRIAQGFTEKQLLAVKRQRN